MIFRTSFYFHANTSVVEIYNITLSDSNKIFVINMTHVAMTTLYPRILRNHENVWYTITKTYNLCKNIELYKLSCVLYHIRIKHEQTPSFFRAILLNMLHKLVEASVMVLTSKHYCATLITSCKETSIPV